MVETILSKVFSASPPTPEVLENIHSAAVAMIARFQDTERHAPKLTRWEMASCRRSIHVASVMKTVLGKSSTNQQARDTSIVDAFNGLYNSMKDDSEAVTEETYAASGSWKLPTWEYYHGTYCELELLMAENKVVAKAMSHCKSTLRMAGSGAQKVAELTKQIQQLASARLKEIKDRNSQVKRTATAFLGADDAVSELIKAIDAKDAGNVGSAVEAVVGLPNMKRILRGLGDAAMEGIKGIDEVTLP